MPTKKDVQQFVLLPVRGLRAEGRTASTEGRDFLLDANMQLMSSMMAGTRGSVSHLVAPTGGPKLKMRVLDSIHEDGAKLVEMTPEQALSLRENQPGLKLVPIRFFYPQVQRFSIETKVAAASSTKLRLTIVSKVDGKPIPEANVVAFTDFANRIGAGGITSSKGIVDLALGSMSKKLERLYVYPVR